MEEHRMRWARRIAYWLRFRSRNNDLREELAFHQDLLTADFERRGLSSAEARAAARRALGNDTFVREEARAVWLAPAIDAVLQDWRYAWRALLRSPGFAIVAIVSLAFGIGANTAIFGVIHAVLLARVPIAAPETLIQLQRDYGAKGRDERFTRDELTALESGPVRLAAFSSTQTTAVIDGVPVTASLDAVGPTYFDLIGIGAQRGRVISATDEADAAPVVAISDRFWRTHMNADSLALGRVITVNGQPFTIVGIMPPGFAGLRFPAIAELMVPLRAAASFGILRVRDGRQALLTVVGRRPAGVSLDRVQSALAIAWDHCCAAGERITAQRGQPSSASRLVLVDVSRGIPQVKLDLRGRYTRILMALMAGVGVLLLAACANVANLLLARASARTGEMAVRLALGASRRRLVLQLVVESMQLAVLGAVAGALLARWGTNVLTRMKVGDLSRVLTPTIGASVLGFTVVVSVLSALIFGVAPTLRLLRSDLATPLKQNGQRAVRGDRDLFDRGLVAAQMALALLLMSGATLLVQTLRNLEHLNLGFDPGQRLIVSVDTRRTSYERQGMTRQMADEILRRVRALPGVRTAAFGSVVPVYGGRMSFDDVVVRGEAPPADEDRESLFTAVTPGYFSSLGMPLLGGRDVSAEPLAATREVVVNEQFARKFFPGRDVIGRVFADSDAGDSSATENRIVGVVAGARYADVRDAPKPMYFVPIADHDWPYLVLIVHVVPGATVGGSVLRSIAEFAPGIGLSEPTRLSTSIDEALVRERVSAELAIMFGCVALALVAIGLYGLMAYRVSERTREIGIRMALGAGSRRVISLVLWQSLTIVGVGVAAGFPLAMIAGRAVSSQLYGVPPYSLGGLSVAAATLVLVAVAATLEPVRRAVAVDPVSALRN
jgi:putative ABC transport system permease protein